MEERKLICIGCPKGCGLTAVVEGAAVVSVSGNTCKHGAEYAKKELTNPTRIVTTSVRVLGGRDGKVPVKTAADIPKGKIFRCMEEVKKVTVKAPIHIGDVILKNAADTGVDVVATKNIGGV